MESDHQIFHHFVKPDNPINSLFYTCLRRISKFRHLFEAFILVGLISWSSSSLDLSTYLFNHHVVFLIGNAIIVILFLLCRRQNDTADDFYDEYIKHSDAAVVTDMSPPAQVGQEGEGEGEDEDEDEDEDEGKQIVVCDDIIEKARRQIKRFERTQSEKLKREIRTPALRRSETFERLSSEEFRRTIDAFIDQNWKTKKKLQFDDEYQKFQMAY